MSKILIIDDHPLFRESMASILATLEPSAGTSSIFQAEDAVSALALITKNSDFDLILTDIDMPGMDGLLLLQQLTTILPDTTIVMISGSEKHTDVQQALKLGAKGFIQKNSETPILLAALQLILAGGTYLPPLLLNAKTPAIAEPAATANLTRRQLEILAFLKQGLQNKVIAHELDLSEATVKVHVRHIFSVLGVKNRTQAVQKALELGIL